MAEEKQKHVILKNMDDADALFVSKVLKSYGKGCCWPRCFPQAFGIEVRLLSNWPFGRKPDDCRTAWGPVAEWTLCIKIAPLPPRHGVIFAPLPHTQSNPRVILRIASLFADLGWWPSLRAELSGHRWHGLAGFKHRDLYITFFVLFVFSARNPGIANSLDPTMDKILKLETAALVST